MPVINADTIMLKEGLSPVASGRKALRLIGEHISRRQSFLYETTLSGKGFLRLIEKARQAGFFIALHYVGVDSPDLSCERVRARFESGQGHHVPPDDIRRRYERSLEHLPQFLKVVDHAVLYDNSGLDPAYVRLCEFRRGEIRLFVEVDALPAWAKGVIDHLAGI